MNEKWVLDSITVQSVAYPGVWLDRSVMTRVAEQLGAGAPETSVRCGARVALSQP